MKPRNTITNISRNLISALSPILTWFLSTVIYIDVTKSSLETRGTFTGEVIDKILALTMNTLDFVTFVNVLLAVVPGVTINTGANVRTNQVLTGTTIETRRAGALIDLKLAPGKSSLYNLFYLFQILFTC